MSLGPGWHKCFDTLILILGHSCNKQVSKTITAVHIFFRQLSKSSQSAKGDYTGQWFGLPIQASATYHKVGFIEFQPEVQDGAG